MTSSPTDRYAAEGFLHLTGVFSTEDIDYALQAVAALPEWIRRRSGDRNVQRLQPLQSCEAVPDPGWIKSFYANPGFERIVDQLFRDIIQPPPRPARDPQLTALLIEPLDRWWSTGLHRDYRDLIPALDLDAWWDKARDMRVFNQINIPLLDDTSLWAVPGSHTRSDNEREVDMVRSCARYRECRVRETSHEHVDACRSELTAGLRDCGAINIEAAPGDVVFYRSNMLHCGIYEPAVRRLTLHDGVYSAEWHQYVLDTFAPETARSGGRSQIPDRT